jgi:cytochrome oxidase Cu insertion factor (SCO1/SenC/PrrC family)
LIKDKAVVVNAVFASCNDACPLITANLTRVHELLSERGGATCSFT